MNSGDISIKLSDNKSVGLFSIGVFFMTIKTSLSFSKIIPYNDLLDNMLVSISLLCFIIVILNKKYNLKTLIIYLVIGILTLYSCIITGENLIMITVISILALRNFSFDKFINQIFKIEITIIMIHLIYSFICLIFLQSTKISQNIMGITRFDFGFSHPNVFSSYLYGVILMWVWLNYSNIQFKQIVGIFSIGVISYAFTKTRTSFINLIIMLMLVVFCKKLKKNQSKVIKKISMMIVPMLSLISLIMIINYDKRIEVIDFIDNLLTQRVKLGAYAYVRSGITIFGQYIDYYNAVEWTEKWRLTNFTFDNIYTYFISTLGIIWIVIISFLFYKIARKSSNKVHIFIISWSLYGVTEIHGLNGFYCFPIFLVIFYLNKDKKLIDNL